jgi:hypothetical protein
MKPIHSMIAATAILAFSALPAEACGKSIVVPGNNTTDPVHTMRRGTSCTATFNFGGLQINRMSIVQAPKGGSVQLIGNNRYLYRSGGNPGRDEFIVEFDTTSFDWQTGNPTFRSKWQVRQPFVIE